MKSQPPQHIDGMDLDRNIELQTMTNDRIGPNWAILLSGPSNHLPQEGTIECVKQKQSYQKKAWLASAQERLLLAWHRICMAESPLTPCWCHTKRRFGRAEVSQEGLAGLMLDKPSFSMTMTKILRPVFVWHNSSLPVTFHSNGCP